MQLTPESTFVIALCAMANPMRIPQPQTPPLSRFRFFLTRRHTNGREFFVLHMGHFATSSEAEKWLSVLRGTYPNAYVSDTSEAVEGLNPAGLSDSQVLRVLEVRHPTPDAEAESSAIPPAPETVRKKTPLDESLQSLASHESGTGSYESMSDTGVRHLRIEVVKKRRSLFSRSRTRIT
jgi:hypothetical protein